MQSKKPKKKYALFLILLLLLLIYIFFGSFIQIFLISLLDQVRTPNSVTSQPLAEKAKGNIDQNLIANWDTGCLIPNPRDNYAERHTFLFNTDGKANHKRYMGASCSTMNVDHDERMTWEIVGNGKINIYYTDTGGAIYDIYDISSNTLRFGHGFCNCSNSGGTYGFSEGDRFVKLNDFLSYKKQ